MTFLKSSVFSPGNQFHFPEIRIVEASAGSGKTYALAKRYVQLLLNAPDAGVEAALPLRSILAITFTNKAATEMKARILEFLKRIALNKLPPAQQEDILRPLNMNAQEAGTRAFVIMESLIRHYNFFQVQTIDKFINALLSGCAFKIGLTANFRIRTNGRDCLEYALDRLIDRAAQDRDIRQVFEYFLHNYLYLENRSGWFPKKDMNAILYTLFAQTQAYPGKLKEGPSSAQDLVRKKKLILQDIKTLRASLPEAADRRFLKSLDDFLAKNTQLFDIDTVSSYFAREELPLRKGADIPPQVSRLWARIHGNLREVCHEEAYGLFNPYIRIFNTLESVLEEVAAKEDVLFLEQLNKKAGRLFDEDYVTVAELYYRLASRFRHYLIDEFQDTSRLQWHNLEKMAEEALATGGSLFYVGDRKQAIYGFRGGEAGLFDDVRERLGAFPARTEYLTRNWRSQKAVIDFNNRIFSPENLKGFIARKEEYEKIKKKNHLVAFAPEDYAALDHLFGACGLPAGQAGQSGREERNGGYVRVERLAPAESQSSGDRKPQRDELIRTTIITLIRQLHERFACGDIAILTRNNAQVEQMTRWLLEAGIQVDSERTSDITRNRIVQEIIAFLRFLDSPIDNPAFSAFILGEILPSAAALPRRNPFGIIRGLPRETVHEFVFQLRDRLAQQKDAYVYTEFRKRFPEVWQTYFEEFFSKVGLYPLYELVVSFYNRFQVLERFPDDQGFLMHLLELIKKQEEEHSDIGSFLEYFDHLTGEDLYVRARKIDAVEIMTVHKAKGLEFPAVILPCLTMDVQVGTNGADYAPSYLLRQAPYNPEGISTGQEGAALELLRLKSKYYSFSDELYQIYAQEYKKAFLAELNNVYVALTRAREELYVFLPPRSGNAFNLAQLLIPDDVLEIGTPAAGGRGVPAAMPEALFLELPPARYHNWIHYLKDEFRDTGAGNRRQRLRGEVIHFMLSLIGNLEGTDVRKTLDWALAQAQANFSLPEDAANYSSILEQLLADKKTKPFFFCADARVLTEKEIVNAQGHLKRLDRLIINDGEVWIVDFKSGEESDVYVAQVREYISIVGGMYSGKRVRGFLVYLDKIEVEEVNSNH